MLSLHLGCIGSRTLVVVAVVVGHCWKVMQCQVTRWWAMVVMLMVAVLVW